VRARSTGPLAEVLAAVASGANTRVEVRRRVDYPDDVVDAALDHLIRTGRVVDQPLTVGCVSSGCGGCPIATRCGQSLPVSTATCQL
jgi:hypothetical protein